MWIFIRLLIFFLYFQARIFFGCSKSLEMWILRVSFYPLMVHWGFLEGRMLNIPSSLAIRLAEWPRSLRSQYLTVSSPPCETRSPTPQRSSLGGLLKQFRNSSIRPHDKERTFWGEHWIFFDKKEARQPSPTLSKLLLVVQHGSGLPVMSNIGFQSPWSREKSL